MDDDMLRETARPVTPERSPLTFREMQVMELVERGMKNKEIGAQLGIRSGTVKIHLKHIFEKTGIRGRYGLALSGLREKGLLAVVE
jgi:DNA-binding NarL/FixJ family response regulator